MNHYAADIRILILEGFQLCDQLVQRALRAVRALGCAISKLVFWSMKDVEGIR